MASRVSSDATLTAAPGLSVAYADDVQALADMADSGTLTPVVGRAYPLDEAGAAIAHAGSGHAR